MTPFERRLYGLVLRLYPEAFRRLWSDEMRGAFEALRARAAGERGRLGVLLLWARTIPDALVSGARERASGRGYRIGFRSSLRFPRVGLLSLLADARQDTRYAARTLLRTPAWSVMLVVTLALGIGANSAVFSVVHGVLLEPLPFPGGGEVVHLRQVRQAAEGPREMPFSVAEIEDVRARTTTLERVAEYHRMTFTLTGAGEPDNVTVGVVSHDFFDLLGVRPRLGREFVAAEDRPGADPVVVLGHGYWQDRFGGDPTVVGRTVTMNERPHRIIGVLPSYPQFPQENDVYMPISVCPTRSSPGFIADRAGRMMSVYARLGPGADLAGARREMAHVVDAMEAGHPAAYGSIEGHAGEVERVREELVAGARGPLLLLLAAASFVLLIACANAANLALARANRRVREIAVRSALGAGRPRIARQLLTEHVLLAVVGGALGLGVAFAGVDLLSAYAARYTTRAAEVGVDGPVVLFTLLSSVATGLLFGAAPAATGRRALAVALVEGSGSTPGGRRRRLQDGLVVAQIAVAFALLAGAGLMLRSFWAVRGVDPGVDTEEVIAFEASLNAIRYDEWSDVVGFFREVEARLLEVPGVVTTARAMEVPLGESHGHTDRFLLAPEDRAGDGTAPGGAPPPSARAAPPAGGPTELSAFSRTVGPGFFETLGVEVLQGRPFLPSDTLGAAFVGVVNRTFAERYFPPGTAVGRELVQCWEEECNPPMTIVGVVEDVRTRGPEQRVPPDVYRSALQVEWGGEYVVVRVRGATEDVLPLIAQVVHSVDPDVPVTGVTTLAELRGRALAPRRLTASLLLVFAGVAVALTLAGIFGVLTLAASSRTLEMGIRRAFGARPGEVGRMVVREGVRLVTLGLVLGLGLALALGRGMRTLLWGVEPGDPLTLALSAGLFLAVAWLACWLPARRMSGLDVVGTLRSA